MHSAPPKTAERIVGFLIPPASREEVLGDLYERCTSSGQYILDALLVLPRVILSRIRRTTDAQVLCWRRWLSICPTWERPGSGTGNFCTKTWDL